MKFKVGTRWKFKGDKETYTVEAVERNVVYSTASPTVRCPLGISLLRRGILTGEVKILSHQRNHYA